MRGRLHIGFVGPIESRGASNFVAALNCAANQGFESVYISLSSSGGLAVDAYYLANHIQALPIKVIMHNTGAVESAAVLTFLAAEERYTTKYAPFVIHSAKALKGSSEERQEVIEHTNLTQIEILRERTRIPQHLLDTAMRQDVIISPPQALEYGIVDGIKRIEIPPGTPTFQVESYDSDLDLIRIAGSGEVVKLADRRRQEATRGKLYAKPA